MVRVASVQMDVAYGDPSANATVICDHLRDLGSQSVKVAVFPETALTGYCVASLAEAVRIAIPFDPPDPVFAQIQAEVDAAGMVAVVGFAERRGAEVSNSAAIFEAGKPVRIYRKTHIPCLGLDRFVIAGEKLEVFDTQFGRFGVLICFDMRPPEAARTLALAGAEAILLPTNWPVGAETSAEYICVARAAENKIFMITCNRAGTENGFEFIGRSKIIGVGGEILAAADSAPVTLIADIDPEEARQKLTVNIPGEYEINIIACRRPELYGPLSEREPR